MYSLYITPPLPACIVYDCREGRGVIYREYTECYSISFLFLFFFHQSSLYPIKIFAKCFYLLVYMGPQLLYSSCNFRQVFYLFFTHRVHTCNTCTSSNKSDRLTYLQCEVHRCSSVSHTESSRCTSHCTHMDN